MRDLVQQMVSWYETNHGLWGDVQHAVGWLKMTFKQA